MRVQIRSIAVAGLILLVSGCNDVARQVEANKLRDALDEVAQLQRQSNEQQRRIGELQKQVTVLQGFGPERLDKVVTVAAISLGRFTRAYDLNDDGVDEGVNVYVVLKDRAGDTIKAGGEVEIDVLDLAAEPGSRDVGNWRFSPAETADHWLGGFGTNYFKFQLAWPAAGPPKHANLTIVARFKDALTGRSFEEQKVITAAIPCD